MKAKKIKSKLGKNKMPAVIARPEKQEDAGNFPISHYSYSSMVQFTTNPLLWKIKYINHDRYDTTTSISGVIGQAFHKAMEVYYGGNPDMMPKDEPEAIEMGLRTAMGFLEGYEEGFIKYSKSIPDKQKARDIVAFVFNAYVKERPNTQNEEVLAIEDDIEEDIDIVWRGQTLRLPVRLKGYLDKVVKTKDGKIIIKDYKTCYAFSDPEKIDGSKMIQAVQYYLLAYAKYGIEPYSMIYEEIKTSKNSDGSPQVRIYEIIYAENELYFDFYFRLYEDITSAVNGKQVYVPNVYTLFDNEVAIISYIHRLDVEVEKAKEMKKLKVENITDLLKKKIQKAGNMRKFLKTVERDFCSAKNLNYNSMTTESKIQTKMMEHGMMIQFDSKIEGATVDLYRYMPSVGLKMKRITNYIADMEQVIGKSGIRILAPIPDTSFVGFEVPREERTFPKLPKTDLSAGFSLAIGQTISGEVRRYDIRTAPHMLVAGATGSGKTVFLNSIIRQLLKIPNADLVLYDPKCVEMAQFENKAMEYLSDHEEIAISLESLVQEMEMRYSQMKKAGKRNISEMEKMRYKFVIIDEYADIAIRQKSSVNLQLLAQKGRACGIHLIIATQRASTKIITGDIKVNFVIKAVFRMSKAIDSRVMIDEDGAEKLLGKGDMLFATETGTERLQGYNSPQ